MTDLPELAHVEIQDAAALWTWLAAHHAQPESVLLITWKAAHRTRFVSRDAVLDALIAYGWIDGRRYQVDADRTAQLISPRKTGRWAQSYKDRAARLMAEGAMMPPGLAAIDAAKASGAWGDAKMAQVDRLAVPDDLDAALGPHRTGWDRFAPSYRRNVLRWLALAKTAPTRTKRIDTIVAATAAGRKIPQM